MSAILPLDVIRHVVGYSEDIDVRREYGIFSRINMKKYENLKAGCVKIDVKNEHLVRITQHNLYGAVRRKTEKIQDDYWDVQITERGNTISFYIIKHQYLPCKYYKGRYEYSTKFYDYVL